MAVVHQFIIPEHRAQTISPERHGSRLGGAEIVILPCVRRETFSDWTTGLAGERTISVVSGMMAAEQTA